MDQRLKALETALSDFTSQDVHDVIETVKAWQQRMLYNAARQFSYGDRVEFRSKRYGMVTGMITGFNKKSVSVRTKEGVNWKVSPTFLSKKR